MPTYPNLDPFIAADPAAGREPTAETRDAVRARLDALLASEPAARTRPSPRRRRAFALGGLAALTSVVAIAALSLTGDATSPAQAFAARLQGDGVVHMVLAHERTHDVSGDGVNPRQDELWMSLADGTWRVRTRLYGFVSDMAFDGRSITNYSSRTGKTTTDTPTDPSSLAGHPFPGPNSPGVLPLGDVESARLKVAGETTINGETVYDLVPTRALPQGFELHWYVSKDGQLRRMVQSAADTIDEARGTRGPSSLTTDVESYDVLAPTDANRALLRVPSAPR
jgi:hypothetical protein